MKIIFAGGGTGGHIYPAVSIAKEMKKKYKNIEILFIGTDRGMEKDIVPNEGFELKKIKVRGFERKLTVRNLIAVKEAAFSIIDVSKILSSFKPDLVVGTGGYVCGTVLLSAALAGIPTLIHEQNAFAGITNKILSRFVDKIAITFEESSKYFKDNKKIVFTGNPLRDGFLTVSKADGINKLGLKADLPIVLVVGGSRGAKKINESVLKLAQACIANRCFQLLHITGDSQYEYCLKLYADKKISLDHDLINIFPYLHNMPDALAAADLVIGRCGAGVLSEITAMGKPSILIPYPYATDNHQEYNARALEKNGAAVVILERDINEEILYEQVMNLINNSDRIEDMKKHSKGLGKPYAAKMIADELENLAHKKR